MIQSFPSNTASTIEEIISKIGRDVEFFTVYSSYPCSGCSLDPVTQTSTNSFCVICSGLYWIPIYSGVSISGHITWKNADLLDWQSGGMLFNGDCLVKIPYSNTNYSIVEHTRYVVVDNKELKIMDIVLRGAPSTNRILLNTKEKEK